VRRNVYHIEFRYIAQKWPTPPKDIKSPQILADILSEAPQDALLECDGYFAYDEAQGWKSTIELPQPIVHRKKPREPFTHIEAIRLSKREENKIRYSVQIGRTPEGIIRHWVHLLEGWRGALSAQVPEILLEHSADLSRAFVNEEQEA